MKKQAAGVTIVLVVSGADRELPRGLAAQLHAGDELLWADGLEELETVLRHSPGRFILLAEACDAWHPSRREACITALSKGAMAAVHDAVVVDGDMNEVAGSLLRGMRIGPLRRRFCPPYMGCCMALRREVLDRALPFPKKVTAPDFWLGAMAARLGRVAYLERALMFHRSTRTGLGRGRLFGTLPSCCRALGLRLLAWRRVRGHAFNGGNFSGSP